MGLAENCSTESATMVSPVPVSQGKGRRVLLSKGGRRNLGWAIVERGGARKVGW